MEMDTGFIMLEQRNIKSIFHLRFPNKQHLKHKINIESTNHQVWLSLNPSWQIAYCIEDPLVLLSTHCIAVHLDRDPTWLCVGLGNLTKSIPLEHIALHGWFSNSHWKKLRVVACISLSSSSMWGGIDPAGWEHTSAIDAALSTATHFNPAQCAAIQPQNTQITF